MNRRLLIFVLAASAIVAAAVLLWHPWDRCHAPEPVCTAVGAIKAMDNVVDATADYDALDSPNVQGPLLVQWTVRLPESVSPQQAAATASSAAALARAVQVDTIELDHFVRIVAGAAQATEVRGLERYPVDVTLGADPFTETVQAFSLRQLGALQVGTASATAADSQSLLSLAAFAQKHGYAPTLELPDGTVRYTPNGKFAVDEVRLALDAAQQPDVESSIFGSGSLSVHLAVPGESERDAAMKRWLDKREPLSRPTAYTLSGPGFTAIAEGWVGGAVPEALIAKPPVLPEGVTAWPANPKAPTCTRDDVQLSLSAPDAAAGSRFLALYARNVSGHPCALQGYAQINFLNVDGEEQADAATRPATHLSAERIVLPAGQSAISTLRWAAMSTSQDPDQTTALRVAAAIGMEPVNLIPRQAGSPAALDILDGARVELSPWLQAAEGWAMPEGND